MAATSPVRSAVPGGEIPIGEIPIHELSSAELRDIHALLDDIDDRYDAVDAPEFLADVTTLAQELPRGVRHFVNRARLEDLGLFAVTGYRIDDAAIGPTPAHWEQADPAPVRREGFLLLLYAALLGDPYALSVLQGGKLVNEVVPIRGKETSVTAGSSEQRLMWHTEEAGFDERPDFQCFVTMRNADYVPTMVAHVDWLRLDAGSRRVLRMPRFVVSPWGAGSDQRLRIAPLFGGPDSPYIRFDPLITEADPGDDEAAAALLALESAVESALRPLRHAAGDYFFIDNWRAVHGRDAYTAAYQGRDRWLKRVKSARNLRVSRYLRDSATDRVVRLEQLFE